MTITYTQEDCMVGMARYPDKYFDLAIVDPPYFKGVANRNFYGSDLSRSGVKRLCSESGNWDDGIPSVEYYEELTRVSKEQIIWGCNYYKFLQPVGRIVWDKKNDTSTFSNCELASVSLMNSVKIYRYEWNGMLQENMKNKEHRIHPTQKPVALYKWLLKNYAKQGDLILDTHVGSASSLIACYDLGFDAVGFEIDEDYYKSSKKRLDETMRQVRCTEYLDGGIER
ncbi:MAG: site-specific DNA-methyltransferase [Trichococcus flocculiformis]|uniref:Methyltransferase n=1 Tax=Trichococcus flocculiformis TaxID=82803 RepID=A0A847D786_9LACT|nr:DNA methyltransferase [Trichococcus flocculiformis]NLD33161.1 site-specific DNA-methyltransferase [Trichococcus flocculiformis]